MTDIVQALAPTLSDYGAVPDGRHIQTVTIHPGSDLLTGPDASFSEIDVGKNIAVAAGSGATNLLRTTIAEYLSPTQVKLASPTSGAVVNVDRRGATVGTDCGPALLAAINDIIDNRGGGDLVIDGAYALFTPVYRDFASGGPDTSVGVAFTTVGQPGRIHIACGKTENAIEVANGSVAFCDVALVGTSGALSDAGSVIQVSAGKLELTRAAFIGLMNDNAGEVIFADQTEVVITDCHFGGCSGSSSAATPVVRLRRTPGLTVRNTQFLDYGSIGGQYFSKTSLGSAYAWVLVESMGSSPTFAIQALNQGVIRFTDVRMDEGAYHQILIGSVGTIDRVDIEGVECNAWGNSVGCIVVRRTRDVSIRQCSMGLQSGPVLTAIVLDGCSYAKVDGIQVGRGSSVTRFTATGCTVVELSNSPGFTDFNIVGVDDFRRIVTGRGGIVPFSKAGTITDADFIRPPVVGTLAVDTAGQKLSVKMANGTWKSATLV